MIYLNKPKIASSASFHCRVRAFAVPDVKVAAILAGRLRQRPVFAPLLMLPAKLRQATPAGKTGAAAAYGVFRRCGSMIHTENNSLI